MQTHEEQTIKQHKLKEVYCDKCGKQIYPQNYDCYNAYEFDWFNIKKGERFPEGGYGTKVVMDLCETCSTNLAIVLQDLGYHLREEEWDY